MKHLAVGIAFVVIGVIIVALQPAIRRGLSKNGASKTGVRIYGNVVTGVVIAAFGVAVIAGAF